MGSLRCSWRFVRLLGDLFFLTGYRFEFLQKLLNQLFFRLFVELAETNRFHRWLRLRALNQLLKHPKLAGWCHLVEAVVTGAHNHQCRVTTQVILVTKLKLLTVRAGRSLHSLCHISCSARKRCPPFSTPGQLQAISSWAWTFCFPAQSCWSRWKWG